MLLADLEFASYLSYAPRGDSDEAKRSRNLTYALKADRVVGDPPLPLSTILARHLQRALDRVPFAAWLGPTVTLVPVPKSSLMQRGTLWVPQRLADAMVDAGLGGESLDLLRRIEAVRKSAFGATIADRPRADDHYRTLSVEGVLGRPGSILLVDDVITTGASLLAAASRLAEAFPGVRLRGFAFIRTLSNPADFAALESPCSGTVRLQPNGRTQREP